MTRIERNAQQIWSIVTGYVRDVGGKPVIAYVEKLFVGGGYGSAMEFELALKYARRKGFVR